MFKDSSICETYVGGEGSLSTISVKLNDLERIGDVFKKVKLFGAMTPQDEATDTRRAVFRVISPLIVLADGVSELLCELGSSRDDLIFAGIVEATASKEWVDPKTDEIVENPSLKQYLERGLLLRAVREVVSVTRDSVTCRMEYGHDGFGSDSYSGNDHRDILGALSITDVVKNYFFLRDREIVTCSLMTNTLKEAVQRLIDENLM